MYLFHKLRGHKNRFLLRRIKLYLILTIRLNNNKINQMIEARQIDRSGKLGPMMDICEVAAQNTMKERWGKDTDPSIVQMILRKQLVPHWYYRSNEWIAQPYYLPKYFLQPYVGPSKDAPPHLYGEGTYILDKEATKYSLKLAKKG